MKLVPAVLASPKSRIFRVQSDFTTILLGLRSWRWGKTGVNKLLPASLQPAPLPLPRSSIVSARFGSLSCGRRSLARASAVQPEPSAVRPRVGAQGRGREALQAADIYGQENKTAPALPAPLQAERSGISIGIPPPSRPPRCEPRAARPYHSVPADDDPGPVAVLFQNIPTRNIAADGWRRGRWR
ncbi:hypothetical protein EYF80_036432 [Liparis tanakae]|uniref:Uncharacterized protein n=1 Tax=Liparis tanakae TaxID=230148 RepID=A0A4Z2GJD3_9TELE|nr:hypothetical protein EYF80_036432 [Liparis tanakae]